MNASAAEIDITPDFEVELCGFASRTQPSIGVLEPIYARALFLDNGDAKLLWIATDIVAFERDFVESFRAWAKRELKLEPHQVLLAATHTHSAPATIRLTAAGAYSERYVELLGQRLRDLATRATAKTEPCRIISGRATLDLAIDRRNKPTAHVDPFVWALAVARDDVSNIAAVLNYTMHPVALGHNERRISPDWCGGASAALSRGLRGSPVALVTNGAAGNINPPANDQSPQVVRGYGEIVARAAIDALASAKDSCEAGGTQADDLRTKSITVAVPLECYDEAGVDRVADEYIASIKPDWVWAKQFKDAVNEWRRSLKPLVARGGGREVPIELHAIRIGDLRIVAVNGEMFTRFTQILRDRCGDNIFTVAYANSAFGYIPTREAYGEGGYEVETAHFFYRSFRPKPGGLELLADRAVELVKSL